MPFQVFIKQLLQSYYNHCSSFFLDTPVCKEFFLWVNSIGDSRFKVLVKTYKTQSGAHPREFLYRGGARSGLTVEDSNSIVTFLDNIAEIHSLALPGRVPGNSYTSAPFSLL